MDRNKILLAGFTVLLAVGLVAAVKAMNGIGRQPWDFSHRRGVMLGGCGGHGNKTSLQYDLGLPENATYEQIRDAIWGKELKELGLTGDSTLSEYRQAMKEKMETKREERMQHIREKLNLLENATQEDIQKAMQAWREENKDMMSRGLPCGGLQPGLGMRGRCSLARME